MNESWWENIKASSGPVVPVVCIQSCLCKILLNEGGGVKKQTNKIVLAGCLQIVCSPLYNSESCGVAECRSCLASLFFSRDAWRAQRLDGRADPQTATADNPLKNSLSHHSNSRIGGHTLRSQNILIWLHWTCHTRSFRISGKNGHCWQVTFPFSVNHLRSPVKK